MKQPHAHDHNRVVKVKFNAGVSTSKHIATSDAFVIAGAGSALLTYAGETYELSKGVNILIPANEQYTLKILEDFEAYIMLEKNAEIKNIKSRRT